MAEIDEELVRDRVAGLLEQVNEPQVFDAGLHDLLRSLGREEQATGDRTADGRLGPVPCGPAVLHQRVQLDAVRESLAVAIDVQIMFWTLCSGSSRCHGFDI
jgi:hypothetical protein